MRGYNFESLAIQLRGGALSGGNFDGLEAILTGVVVDAARARLHAADVPAVADKSGGRPSREPAAMSYRVEATSAPAGEGLDDVEFGAAARAINQNIVTLAAYVSAAREVVGLVPWRSEVRPHADGALAPVEVDLMRVDARHAAAAIDVNLDLLTLKENLDTLARRMAELATAVRYQRLVYPGAMGRPAYMELPRQRTATPGKNYAPAAETVAALSSARDALSSMCAYFNGLTGRGLDVASLTGDLGLPSDETYLRPMLVPFPVEGAEPMKAAGATLDWLEETAAMLAHCASDHLTRAGLRALDAPPPTGHELRPFRKSRTLSSGGPAVLRERMTCLARNLTRIGIQVNRLAPLYDLTELTVSTGQDVGYGDVVWDAIAPTDPLPAGHALPAAETESFMEQAGRVCATLAARLGAMTPQPRPWPGPSVVVVK